VALTTAGQRRRIKNRFFTTPAGFDLIHSQRTAAASVQSGAEQSCGGAPGFLAGDGIQAGVHEHLERVAALADVPAPVTLINYVTLLSLFMQFR
jgi:hypothetical protein